MVGQPLLVVICGSATSWVIENILTSSGDLAARVTESIFLEPFTLAESEAYFRDRGFDWDRETIVETQMVFGGLPSFFSLMRQDLSLGENIDRLCLSPRAQLRDETMILLDSTMRRSRVYSDLFRLLASRKHGVRKSDACTSLGYSEKQFATAVKEAVRCGYISEYRNPGKPNKPKYIQLIDPFILFHYHVIDPEHGKRPSRWAEFVMEEGRYTNWRDNAFEIVCLYHVNQLKAALGISGLATNAYPWLSDKREGGAQIDLVIERPDRTIDLCEMKFTNQPFDLSADNERKLVRKCEVFRKETKTRLALRTVLMAVTGTRGTRDREIAKVVSIDDLFRA